MASIQLRATAKIHANATPRIEIVAYNGGIMSVQGVGPLVVDLTGLEIPGSIPLLVDHENSISQTVGTGRPFVDGGNRLLVTGSLVTDSEIAQHVLALAKIQSEIRASIGADILESRMVQEGEDVHVNGRTITGPEGGFTLVTSSRLFEVSIVSLGADNTTQVKIAARRIRGTKMDFQSFVTSYGFDYDTLTDKQRQALTMAFEAYQESQDPGNGTNQSLPDDSNSSTATATAIATDRRLHASDVRRVSAIKAVASDQPRICATAIEQGWTVEKTELAVIKARQRANVPNGARREGGMGEMGTNVIECSLLLGQGVSAKFLAKEYGEQVVNCAMEKDNRGANLHAIINASLSAAGRSTGWRRVTKDVVSEAFAADSMIRASGFSGGSVSGLLGNIAGKLLLNSYEMIATTWDLFSGIQSAQNFKAFTAYQLGVIGELKEHARGGSLDHVSLAELAYSNQIKRRGAMISIDQQDIIDDDLHAFAAIPQAFGRLSAIGLERAVYKSLLANLSTLFTTGHGNYFEGGDSALSIASLTTAEQKFLNQVDQNGDPMLLTPKFLGVPTKLSATSAVVTRDTQVQWPAAITEAESTANPHSGKFQPFTSPWFNNSNLEGASDNHWFLLAPPVGNQGIVNVAFLNGQQNPTVEEGAVDFSKIGIAWRVVFDFGVAPGDYRFGVRSLGEAP